MDSLAARVAALGPVADRLLPRSATPLMRGLLTAELVRLAEISPALIATIYDPHRCPASLLPFLAYAVSVDTWDRTWPEDIQRAVIAASPEVHRLKGTVQSIRRALEPFGWRFAITEWWEHDAPEQAGTFIADVFVNATLADPDGGVVSPAAIRAATEILATTKPVTRPSTLRIGVAIDGAAAIHALGQSMATHRGAGRSRHQTQRAVAAAALTVGSTIGVHRASGDAVHRRAGLSRAAALATGQSLAIHRASGSARASRSALMPLAAVVAGQSMQIHRGAWRER